MNGHTEEVINDNDDELSLESTHVRDSLKQIFNYMIALRSQYDVLSSYEYHWFLRRTQEIQRNRTLPLT